MNVDGEDPERLEEEAEEAQEELQEELQDASGYEERQEEVQEEVQQEVEQEVEQEVQEVQQEVQQEVREEDLMTKVSRAESKLRLLRDGIKEARDGAVVAEDQTKQLRRKAEMMRQSSNNFRDAVRQLLDELMGVVGTHTDKEEDLADVEPCSTLEALSKISNDREDQLLSHNRVAMDEALRTDGELTQQLTVLQNRCQTEEPLEYEKTEKEKHDIQRSWDSEKAKLSRVMEDLFLRHRELHYHTNRGTNIKQKWGLGKPGKGQLFHESVSRAEMAEDGKTLKEQIQFKELKERHQEGNVEKGRLFRQLQDQKKDTKRFVSEWSKEEAFLQKQLEEVTKERSELGHERAQLSEICADFSAVIERREEKAIRECGYSSGRSPVIPPMATTFTIGHGRLSPRPVTSPRPHMSQPSPARSTRSTRSPRPTRSAGLRT